MYITSRLERFKTKSKPNPNLSLEYGRVLYIAKLKSKVFFSIISSEAQPSVNCSLNIVM